MSMDPGGTSTRCDRRRRRPAVAPAAVALGCLLLAPSCARRGPPEVTGVPGEQPAQGPAEVALRFRPPAGARIVCPASYETIVSAVGFDRPLRQTLGGEREDVEFVEAVDGGKRTVRRRFGELRWTTAMPLPAPETRDLPPSESVAVVDETGRVESATSDESIALAMALWVRSFDVSPGWPRTPLRRGDSLPRPLRGPGPPGTASTLEAAAPLELVGFATVDGRTCAKFRSDMSGWLYFRTTEDPQAGEPVRSAFRGVGWLCFDLETGALLGSAHTLDYALPLPGPSRPAAIPEFHVRMSSGPCRVETESGGR